ncbi:hypothetical protein D3C72_965800 [compost metagenome]
MLRFGILALQALDAAQVVLALREDVRAGASLLGAAQCLYTRQFRFAKLAFEFGRVAGVLLFIGGGERRWRRAGGQQADSA